jgi:hypothetical protein
MIISMAVSSSAAAITLTVGDVMLPSGMMQAGMALWLGLAS